MHTPQMNPGAGAAPATLAGLPAEAHDRATEYLAFSLGAQEYAANILDVQEIRNFETPTRMVGSAPYALGVLKLRGTIVSVLDLRLRLGLEAQFDHRTATVLLNLPRGTVGLVVDSVSDVVALAGQQIQPLPTLDDGSQNLLFQGLATVQQGDASRALLVMNFDGLVPAGKPISSATIV